VVLKEDRRLNGYKYLAGVYYILAEMGNKVAYYSAAFQVINDDESQSGEIDENQLAEQRTVNI
jgi:hypothetical protein